MDRFWESEMQHFFKSYRLDVMCPIVAQTNPSDTTAESFNKALEGLKAFKKLQKIYEFRSCFQIGLVIEIKDFEKNYNSINQEAQQACYELLKNNADCFQNLSFTIYLKHTMLGD